MKLEEIKKRVTELLGENSKLTSRQIVLRLKKAGVTPPHVSVIDSWRQDATAPPVRKSKHWVTLELYPQDLKKHFAATKSRKWRVKRSHKRDPGTGEEIYTIEKWLHHERVELVHYRTKFFADFLNKFEDVIGAYVKIYQKIDGEEYRLDNAGKLAGNDGVLLGAKKRRRPGQKVSADDRQKIAIMFAHMTGEAKANHQWIANKIGNVSTATVARIIREELANEKSGVPQGENEGFQGAKWVGDDKTTSYPTIKDMDDDWKRRKGHVVDGLELVKDEQEDRRAAA